MTSTIQTSKEIEKARETKRRELSARLKPGAPIIVNTNGERFILKGRPCELSSESFVPPRRMIAKERTFYNTEPKHRDESRLYDSFFANSTPGFNQKLHREDRQHSKLTGIDLYTEETQKSVPSASGSNYGHWNHWARPPSERGPVRYVFDSPDRTFAMRNNIEAEFYRRNKPFPGLKDAELH